MNEIKIHVVGLACTGKSTIIALLNKTLNENGFDNVNIHSNDYNSQDEFLKVSNSHLDDKIKHLKDKISIDIHETNLKHEFKGPFNIEMDSFTSKRIKIVKLSNDTEVPHRNGIESGYEFEGFPVSPLKVGLSFMVNNETGRFFSTSSVTEILSPDTFKTRNSTYRIEIIK